MVSLLRLFAADLLMSQTLDVLSMEQEARKSPHECHEQPHTAWVWSDNVSTHSALEKSQILTVASPEDVARRVPLQKQNIIRSTSSLMKTKDHIKITTNDNKT